MRPSSWRRHPAQAQPAGTKHSLQTRHARGLAPGPCVGSGHGTFGRSAAVRLRALDRPRVFRPTSPTSGTRAGLHRVVDGRECGSRRRRAGSTSSRSTTTPSRSSAALLGLPFELDPFYAFGIGAGAGAARRRSRGVEAAAGADPFESLVTSISAQQVSLFAAFAVRNRFVERFGEPGGARVCVSTA